MTRTTKFGSAGRSLWARWILLACLITLADAQSEAQSYTIVPNITTLPAGTYGVNIHALLPGDTSSTPDVDLCFYTGYGSAAPLSSNVFYSTTGGIEATFDVAPSTIQEVPPAAFTNGTFPALMYTVPIGTTSCTGAAQATPGTAVTLTLEYPAIAALNLASAPQQNPNLTRRLPIRIDLSGSNFLQTSTSTYNSPSQVVFTSSTAINGNIDFVSPSELVSTFPSAIPSTATSVAITVCNTAVYSYCSAPYNLPLTPLQSDFGTVTTSTVSAVPSQYVSFSATFGAGTPSVNGAPHGQVVFSDMGTTLYSAPLLLDNTAAFVSAPSTSFTATSQSLQPIVADFNKDNVPDILYIEPNATTGGKRFPVLHLLLGTTPAGQFAADVPYFGLKPYPCATLLSTALGDFNNDGYPDLAILCSNPNQVGPPSEIIYTLLNRKDGVFSSTVISHPNVFGSSLAAADFNHDGKQDLVIAGPINSAGDAGLQLLFGDGKGAFNIGPISSGLDTAPSASFSGFQIAAADLNGDGFPDIAILNASGSGGSVDNFIQLFQNDGTGAFTRAATVQTDGTPTAQFFVTTISPGQLPDLIITSSASSSPGISVAVNNSAPSISYFDTFQFTPVPGLAQAVVGDFNGDGFPDVAVTDATTTHILTGDGTGVFAATYPSLSVPTAAGSTLLAATDENGDGDADLLAAITSSGTTTVYDYITAGTASAITRGFQFAAGVHRIIASFNGTVELSPAAAQTNLTVTGTTSTIALTTSASSPGRYGSPLTLNAAVTDPTATGTVSFYNGTTLLGTDPLSSNGTFAFAHLTLPVLNAGSYSFTSVYSGDATHSSITSAAFAFVIDPIAPTVSWTPALATIPYGAPLTAAQLDALVSGLAGATVPGTFTYSPALGTILKTGAQLLSVTFTPSNTNYSAVTASASITITQAVTILAWVPNPASIVYGTALTAAQLDASAATLNTASVPGTYTYTPSLGTVLAVGSHTLSVTFNPADTLDFSSASASASITVAQATPVLTWPKPADVIVDTTLSSTQLDATAATPQGATLAGSFVYTPPSGTELSVAGAQTLSVVFTPTDTANYTTASASVSINIGPIGISNIAPSTALLGDGDKTIAITGTGFSTTSRVQIVGPSLPATYISSTYISSTSLTAIIPASDLLTVQTLLVSIYDPTKDLPSNAVPFIVSAPSTSVGFNAPTNISPGSQNTIVFHLAPYPAPVTATVTVTFEPSGSLPDDPNVVFSSGTRAYTITEPAHTAELDLPVTFQSGTVVGALTINLSLNAGGANVTPASVQPIVIQEPAAVPGVSSVTMQQSGDMLTVTTRGFSNTRKITGAAYHFTAIPGQSIGTPDVTLDVNALFSTWYANPSSEQYGSLFTYTEVFNLSSDASVVGQVTVTLTNDVGTSEDANTP
jgi:hypothetical protein